MYYISIVAKHLIKSCCNIWIDWYQDKLIFTKTKKCSDNIVHMTKPVMRYWKKTCKLHGTQRIKLLEFEKKVAQQRKVYRNTIPITFTFCHLKRYQKSFSVNKTRVSLHYQILYHTISESHTMQQMHICQIHWWMILWATLSEYREWCQWNVYESGLSCSNRL